MFKCIKKIVNYKYFYLFFVIFLSFVIFLPFVFCYAYGDDAIFHLNNIDMCSKISAFKKVVPSFDNNLGWGIGIFYPRLAHVFGGFLLRIIKSFGLGAVAAIKIEKFFIIVLSGLFMFALGTKIYKDQLKGVISAILYLFSSYFFVDFYVRESLNECLLFAFIPLVFLGFYYLLVENNTKLFYWCFIIGYFGMIYSHLVMTMWFTIILIVFLLFNFKRVFNKNTIIVFLKSAMILICLSGTFIFPLLEHMKASRWFIPVYDNVWVLPLKDYFIPSYYLTSNGGLLFINFSVIVIFLSLIGMLNYLFKRKNYKYDRSFFGGLLFAGLVSIFFSSQSWIWEKMPSFLKSVQFSWRLVSFSVFYFSLFSCSGLDDIYKIFKDKYKFIVVIIIIVFSLISFYQNILRVNFVSFLDFKSGNNFFTRDYLPKRAYDNYNEIYNYNSDKIVVLEGDAECVILENNTPKMDFSVKKNNDDVVIIQLPRLYYLGYEIVDDNGKKIKYSESDIGLIELNINDDGIYKIRYNGTLGYKIGLVFKICLILFFVLKKIKCYLFKHKKN